MSAAQLDEHPGAAAIDAGPSRSPAFALDARLLPRRLLIASNRLPYRFNVDDDLLTLEPGVSGLVTALDPILRTAGGTWVGWSGTHDEVPEAVRLERDGGKSADYVLRPIPLSPAEIEDYYLGYSNRCLWPLFHYFQEHCSFHRSMWDSYVGVNRRFADAIIAEHHPGDLVWIHDYHLMLTPAMVRAAIPDVRIGFFLHIPFPSIDVFALEPHAELLVEGLLGADLIGFHLDSYAYNFLDAVAATTGLEIRRGPMEIEVGSRVARAGAFPISIDFERFDSMSRGEAVARQVAEIREWYRAPILALGVDRLDYSKGILERLRAIEVMFDRYPDIQGRFTFIQLSAPSRTKVHAYARMREAVERMVGHINGRFGGRGCLPVDYRYESHTQERLAAYYRAADLALITPLRDGMNLVAKEYVASRTEDSGVLVLSRFAGAHRELTEAVMVNPYDVGSTADRIYEALTLTPEEKRRRMRHLRRVVQAHDIYAWLESFLRAVR